MDELFIFAILQEAQHNSEQFWLSDPQVHFPQQYSLHASTVVSLHISSFVRASHGHVHGEVPQQQHSALSFGMQHEIIPSFFIHSQHEHSLRLSLLHLHSQLHPFPESLEQQQDIPEA